MDTVRRQPVAEAAPSTIDAWARGERLPRDDNLKIRRWMIDALAVRLLNHPHGLNVTRSGNVIQIASIEIGLRHVVVENAAGGGDAPGELTIQFAQGDADAVLLNGALSTSNGDLAGPNAGRWFFELQTRLDGWEQQIVDRASRKSDGEIDAALTVLGVLSSIDDRARSTPAEALAVMVRPNRPLDLHPEIKNLLTSPAVDKQRVAALTVVRDHLTQRKSTGLPSVFDAGAVLKDLVPASRRSEIPTSGPGVDLLMWRIVSERQSTTSRSAWAPVKNALNTITAQIGPTEDFAETVRVMDRFVTRGAAAGIFKDPDAHHQYDRLKATVTAANIARLRQLLKYHAVTTGPADVWQLAHDPTQMLRDMADFWTLCNRLLDAAQPGPDTDQDPGDVNSRGRLHTALRALADRLEGQANR